MLIGGMKSIAVETLTHHDSRSLQHVVWSATIGILPPTRENWLRLRRPRDKTRVLCYGLIADLWRLLHPGSNGGNLSSYPLNIVERFFGSASLPDDRFYPLWSRLLQCRYFPACAESELPCRTQISQFVSARVRNADALLTLV